MIGGLYLGELVRLVLVHLSQRGVLFGGRTSPALLSQGSILLEHVAEMEEYVRETCSLDKGQGESAWKRLRHSLSKVAVGL